MKKDWEIKTLGEVCLELFAGGDVPKLSYSRVPTKEFQIPIFSNGEKDKGLYGYTNAARVTKSCLTISARGTIGYTEIREEPFYPAVRLIVAIPNPNIIDLRYLKYVIGSFAFVHSGSSIPQLTIPMVRDHELNLPPLPEQRKIVKFLDEKFGSVDELKRVTERQIVNVKELFDSRLNEVMGSHGDGWINETINDIAEVKGGKRIPKGHKLTTEKTEHPYIRVTDFDHNGSVSTKDIRYISDEVFKKIKNYIITDRDIFISIAGTIGISGIVPPELSGSNLTENACKLVLKKNINHKYIQYFISSRSFQDQSGLLVRTTAQPKLALTRIKTIHFSYPKEIAKQDLVVKELDDLSEQTNELQTIFRKKIIDLEELKESYLEQAFSGNL